MIRRRHRDETGAALVLVLVIISILALGLAGLLSLSDTSVRTTIGLDEQAADQYNADGATKAAIGNLRNGKFNNDVTSTTYPYCFGNGVGGNPGAELPLPNFYPPAGKVQSQSSAAVSCAPDPNSGAAGGLVPIHEDNKPGNAILTLGQVAGEDGINIKALAKNTKNEPVPFNVRGQIVSDSNINVVSGTLQSNVSVRAHSGCSGTIISNPAPLCASSTVGDPNYQTELAFDPDPNAVAKALTLQKVPSTCPGKIVTFTAGYYDDANALSQLMDGTGSCRGSVWWFQPGTYYFDFKNNANPLLSKQSGDVWTIKDAGSQLVAGSPCVNRVNPNTTRCTPTPKPQVPALTPGACQSPAENDDTRYPGVQFIFGGDSRLTIAAGDVEICGTWHDHRPPIALFGLKSGTATDASQTGLSLTKVTTPGDYGASATVAALGAAGGDFATWKSKKNNDSGSMTVEGFAPATPIPAGSMLKSATVRVTHRHALGSTDALSVTVTPTGGSPLAAASATGVVGPSTFKETPIQVDTSGDGSLADQIYKGTFSGAKIALTTGLLTTGDIEDIDTIALDLVYVPPAFRGETETSVPGNCLTLAYTGGGGPCAVFSTTTNYADKLYLQGTTYTPAAVVDITLSNVTQQVLRFGLVSRALYIKETGALSYSGPVIELPDNSLGYGPGGTIVYLSTYVCPGKPSCSSSTGTLLVRSRVFLYDPSGTPEPVSRKVVIQSWSRTR
ncbi:hypothetical protein EV651_105269 [Kribbella sp. VKM Ac-2571]|uniref:hypothetical protein n=1 Tax=Kribbella sp. VKM Ac-2571 TaxID=2512222 RepID=UPI001062338F|nr:hypothetical protein [Kribbella sp. VKM Ac-2571]TDO64045.1 hypothetical protein EV651_105269 [Kribbella sp. VKM Ac-2571]